MQSQTANNPQAHGMNPTVKSVCFYVPDEMYYIFKLHGKRMKSRYVQSLNFVLENEKLRNQILLNNEISAVAKRLFNIAHSSAVNNDYILTNMSPNVISYLSVEQYNLYTRCLEYIRANNLPGNYTYYVLDFLVSTKDKFLGLPEEKVFEHIATKFMINVRCAAAGIGQPKQKNTVYNTIPKAFSPLFFKKIAFCKDVLINKRLRKEVEELLSYKHHQNTSYATT